VGWHCSLSHPLFLCLSDEVGMPSHLSFARVASRYLNATILRDGYDLKPESYAPLTSEDILWKLRQRDYSGEGERDALGEGSLEAALYHRAQEGTENEFITRMDILAKQEYWVEELQNMVDKIRRSLSEEPLMYRVVVDGKTKDKGYTAEKDVPDLREHLKDFNRYEKWADRWELVLEPRPDIRKQEAAIRERQIALQALTEAKKSRVQAWSALYKDLRTPSPKVHVEIATSDVVRIHVVDHELVVGGLAAVREGGSDSRKVVNGLCASDLHKLTSTYGHGEVWMVLASHLPPTLRGQHLGTRLYEMLAQNIRHPAYIVGNACLEQGVPEFTGLTSADARRVWQSLSRKYPVSGLVMRVQ